MILKNMYDAFIKKRAILTHIQNNTKYMKDKEVIKLEGIDYYILKSMKTKPKRWITGDATDSYYLLYKDKELYTVTTETWINRGDKSKLEYGGDSTIVLYKPEILSYNSRDEYIRLFNELYNEIESQVKPRLFSIFGRSSQVAPSPQTLGGKRIAHAATAYKSTSDKVLLLIDNKKLHRSIYVKGNGKAKYCKINNEFVLLSKLKNKVIE